MKIAVYAVRYKGGWNLRLSVDIRVDMTWWLRQNDGQKHAVERWVLLGERIPLSWGVKLCETFKESADMKQWGSQQWWEYILAQLKNELLLETNGAEPILFGAREHICIWDRVEGWISGTECGGETQGMKGALYFIPKRNLHSEIDALDMECVARQANELADLLAGRQLLVAETEALLAEITPGLEHAWRPAAQLAYLQGRLSFAAGLAPAPRTRWSAVRAHKLRCNRCSSGMVYRTSCASCGRKACAYCETCLALGRSRECSLLLRGAAKPVVPCTAAASAEELDRWGLSPAQRAAAEAALRFLSTPPGRVCGRLRPEGRWPRGREWFRRGGAVRRGSGAAAMLGSAPACNEQLSPKPGERAGHIADRQVSDLAAERFLLWAVTGAGKTEMIFPLNK